MTNLIFILGAPRSGTTLLQKILNQHSEIYGGPEFDHLPKILKLYKDLKNSIESGRQEAFYNEESLNKTFTAFIMQLLYQPKKTIYISEKTPSNTLIAREIRELFPECRFIVILRNPKAILSSYKDVGKRVTGNNILFGSNRLVDMRSINNFLSNLEDVIGQKNTMHLHYEDLINDTESNIRSICTFLNLPMQKAMLNPTSNDDIDNLIKKGNSKDLPFITELYGKKISSKNIDKWATNLTSIEKILVAHNILNSKKLSRYTEKYDLRMPNGFQRLLLLIYTQFQKSLYIFIQIKNRLNSRRNKP